METKVNTGAIFKNDKKQGNQPDYRGKVNVNGKEMEIALWLKESSKGLKYFLPKEDLTDKPKSFF